MSTLQHWPHPLRLAAALFVLSLCGGWGVAILNIHDKSTHSGDRPFSIAGVVDRYRGEGWTGASPGEGAVSASHLVDLTHVHSFSMPILFFLSGGIFALSGCPERPKRWVLIASFTDLWINMSSLWAIRYWPCPRAWAWTLVASGLVMSACFSSMAFFSLRDLLHEKPE